MIVVFGSINLDIVLAAPSLPRPGETVLTPGARFLPGGKGANQAVAAARAGARVAMFGCVGRDAFAEPALAGLRAAGVALDGVAAADATTGCAAVCVDPAGENQIVVASGANHRATALQVPDSVLDAGATVLMQQELPLPEVAALARRARGRGARVILNAAPAAPPDPGALSSLDLLIVNDIEAKMTAETLALADADAAALATALGVPVVLTRGARGAACRLPDGSGWTVGALPIRPRDTTGAGDAFCGYLAARLDDGESLAEALRWASVAAGISCLAEGAQDGIPAAGAVAARLAELAPAAPLGSQRP